MRRRRRTNRSTLLTLALLTLAAGGLVFGIVKLARYRHSEDIDARLHRHGPLIERYARANGLPVSLVRRVVRCESGADPQAVSSAGAVGLMQITPITEREVLRRRSQPRGDLFDPAYNLSIGCQYLRQMLDRFGQDQRLALAAYNMGPTRLQSLREAHPELSTDELLDRYAPQETRTYVARVLGK